MLDGSLLSFSGVFFANNTVSAANNASGAALCVGTASAAELDHCGFGSHALSGSGGSGGGGAVRAATATTRTGGVHSVVILSFISQRCHPAHN